MVEIRIEFLRLTGDQLQLDALDHVGWAVDDEICIAQIYWVVARETIDIRVAEVLLRKLESMGNLQGDCTTDFEEILSLIEKEI